MKQQKLTEIRDYQKSPRAYWEEPDKNYRSDIDFTGEVSLTKQSEAEACDINNIMKKYEATGLLPDSSGRQPYYGDFSTMETFQEALHIVSEANSVFHSLPAEIRAKFQNDPAQFLGFIEKSSQTQDGVKELVDLGLAVEKTESSEKVLKDIRDDLRKAPKSADKGASAASSGS